MQINNTSFAQAFQAINPIDANMDKRNELQQAQEQAQQQKRSVTIGVIEHNQTQNNIKTYTNAYQTAVGNDSSSSSNNSLSYSDLQDINQTINRYQIANSDILSNMMERQEENIATTYNTSGVQQPSQTGSVISAYA